MKKAIGLLLSIGMLICLTGCSSTTIGDITLESGESGFYLKNDGTVQYAVSEAFDKDYYDKGELKDAVEEEISAYNSSNLASISNAIESGDVKVSSDVATVTMNFNTIYDFSTYISEYNMLEGEKFYVGTISSNPYDLADKFVSPEGEETLAKNIDKMDAEIIVVDGLCKIQIEGQVLYVSENCTIDEDGIVTTALKSEGTSYIVYMWK